VQESQYLVDAVRALSAPTKPNRNIRFQNDALTHPSHATLPQSLHQQPIHLMDRMGDRSQPADQRIPLVLKLIALIFISIICRCTTASTSTKTAAVPANTNIQSTNK